MSYAYNYGFGMQPSYGGYLSSNGITPSIYQSYTPVQQNLLGEGYNNLYGNQGGLAGVFGMGPNTLQTIGGLVDPLKDLFGMYQAWQGMKMARTGINNQATAYNNNARNQENFVNGVINAFGSSQAKTHNELARKV